MKNFLLKSYAAVQMQLDSFGKDQRGVTAIEYALIGVAMATLLAYIFGSQDSGYLGALKETFDAITTAIQSVTISGSGGSGS